MQTKVCRFKQKKVDLFRLYTYFHNYTTYNNNKHLIYCKSDNSENYNVGTL